MKEVSDRNFGLTIAYLLPGFVALWGVSCFSETVRSWLVVPQDAQPTVGGFLYVTLGSLYTGMTVSAIRWAVLDTIHYATGVSRPTWGFTSLQNALPAFDYLVENHYRHYQFYANGLISMLFAFTAGASTAEAWTRRSWLLGTGMLFIGAVFFAASRDTLRKYHARASQLLEICPAAEEGDGHGQRLPSHRRRGGQREAGTHRDPQEEYQEDD